MVQWGKHRSGREVLSMFWQRKRKKTVAFDREAKAPVIRQSICTGEKTACLRDRRTGKLEEIMLIRNQEDLQEFLDTYGLREDELETIY